MKVVEETRTVTSLRCRRWLFDSDNDDMCFVKQVTLTRQKPVFVIPIPASTESNFRNSPPSSEKAIATGRNDYGKGGSLHVVLVAERQDTVPMV